MQTIGRETAPCLFQKRSNTRYMLFYGSDRARSTNMVLWKLQCTKRCCERAYQLSNFKQPEVSCCRLPSLSFPTYHVFRRYARGNLASKGFSSPKISIKGKRLDIVRTSSTKSNDVATIEKVYERFYEDGGVQTLVTKENDMYHVDIQVEGSDWVLHWGIDGWKAPDSCHWPEGTVQVDDKAVRTPFPSDGGSLRISFHEERLPSKIVFVLNSGDVWMNAGGQDYLVVLRTPDVRDLEKRILEAESTYERWSLFNRLGMASQVIDEAVAIGPEAMALVFTWLRLSFLRQLDWYRGSNYQSKDAAHAQKVLANRIAHAARTAPDPLTKFFARECMAVLPRGGGNGDDIRHGILNLMREYGIREGHRPGIDDKFLETWHQKLHTNTSPEDIAICEAYLAFLRSGTMDEFWRVLWDVGRLTPEDLANMDHPIDPSPCHLPHAIPGFEHYLWILKRTHAGADLDVSFTMCRGMIDDDLAWNIGDFLANRDAWWGPGKIVEIRHRLKSYWNSENASRDILYLDIALDSFFRLSIERMDKGSMEPDDLLNLVLLVLENASIALENEDIHSSLALMRRVANGEPHGRWTGQEWGKAAFAASDYVTLCLESHADQIVAMVQPFADQFGEKCSINQSFIINFSEEVVRSQPVFILSVLLRYLGPPLRDSAGVSKWQIVSQGHTNLENPIHGKLEVMDNLDSIQGKPPPVPTAIIAGRLTGNEDIPENVVAILTGSATDVLSHVAIRARSQNVLLASCFDDGILQEIADDYGNKPVQFGLAASGDVTIMPAAENILNDFQKRTKDNETEVDLIKPFGFEKLMDHIKKNEVNERIPWVLFQPEFEHSKVGAKAMNLAALRTKLPDSIEIPTSIALPFGTFERALYCQGEINREVADKIEELRSKLDDNTVASGIPKELAQLRQVVRNELRAPLSLKEAVMDAMDRSGIVPKDQKDDTNDVWNYIWKSICFVWASKWNDRAWLSRKAQNISEDALYMSVLMQNMVPAKYAFVLHTADPLTGESGKMHGELVLGMGEALVGNFPGRALSFAMEANESLTPRILGLPSKREQLIPSIDAKIENAFPRLNVMVRSDSNGEDLNTFAGAGLYSSIPLVPFQRILAQYTNEPIFFNDDERSTILKEIVSTGLMIETAFDAPQDIEGVVSNEGQIFIVQTRPQVL